LGGKSTISGSLKIQTSAPPKPTGGEAHQAVPCTVCFAARLIFANNKNHTQGHCHFTILQIFWRGPAGNRHEKERHHFPKTSPIPTTIKDGKSRTKNPMKHTKHITSRPQLDTLLEDICHPKNRTDPPDCGSRTISIYAQIEPQICGKVIEQLLAYESHAAGVPVHMFLFSPGGCVNSGLAIIDTMEHITSPVFTYCTGCAASMAAVILAAGHPGYRYILPHGRVMIHQTMGVATGTLDNMRSSLQLQNTMEQELEVLLAAKTGRTIDEIHEATRFDKWFSAADAVEFGLADHLLTPSPKIEPRHD
jgi:ATP-dependent Clp protease protease subunit